MPPRKRPRSTTSTEQSTEERDPILGPDYAEMYGLNMPQRIPFDVGTDLVANDEEAHIIDEFHKQIIATRGRVGINQFAASSYGDIGANTSRSYTAMMGKIAASEANANVGKRTKQLEVFNTSVATNIGRMMLQLDAATGYNVLVDIERDVYKPKPIQPPPRRKGFFPWLGVQLFGDKRDD